MEETKPSNKSDVQTKEFVDEPYINCGQCGKPNSLNRNICTKCKKDLLIGGGANFTKMFKYAIFIIILILLACVIYNVYYRHYTCNNEKLNYTLQEYTSSDELL